MAVYSITDLAKLSGIKAPTLRMWEQRYGVLKPKRTSANVRYYEDDDVRHLLNVALLNRNGLRISRIAKLTTAEITRKVAEIAEVSDEYSTQLDALTLSMLEMDEARFDRILSVNIEQLGFEETMMTVILPFLEKLSLLWMTGSVKPVQEQFTSGLIRRKLMVAIEGLTHSQRTDAPSLVLFLPEGEGQEMSLLLLHYYARKHGYRVYYLGRDVSIRDIEDTAQIVAPDLVFTMLSETFVDGSVSTYVSRLRRACPDAEVLLSGYQASLLPAGSSPQGVRVLLSMNDTLDYLKQFAVDNRRQVSAPSQRQAMARTAR